MNYDWFKIFNLNEFLTSGLVSRTMEVYLSGHGQKEITITRGELISIVYNGVLLPVEFIGKNPYSREGIAVFKNEDDDIFLGIEVPQ